VTNYTSNGTMLLFFLNTLHWLLYIDILIIIFWMYYKDNIGVENQPWVLQSFDYSNMPCMPSIGKRYVK
jgi:hypothetical protein